ncbi:EscV/YscV/HrcV family type III secretion system export apparatus protein [Pseudomonas chlororaphis]|uniref:EscV/YscV/HrcV family type III secretion system export apparatus protein n=1 Tax=Pseudomonas chlororaphis TaxID=587753 RepID=UPI0006A62950|nr:EscV/YscV/HrcV family type III secretion system export apparatus protein [Pseudomonas chlororaphis]AZC32431.1 Type III secretion inner membrane channel protein (LcrD,HrcV,EscV,SsaV) [Pseudomonas chlororaphis subsp. piscium]WDG76940.1 EscV/YscV/HrcV family type III secretion system export apparatus protein [Pseudomonas chlororaphis]WDG83820.1 EscV/YscV/HrcV family type III secretion system export apparatus protein [Pseudomonas chlororaphis]WDG90146.1 EscV/YscV/HrcV family type III secretion s
MNRLGHWLSLAAGRQDIVLAVLLLLAVFMMIVPLPTGLVDLLIAINLTISIVLLMMALYIREPLEFSTFPAVLLITTLFRLALTISTTRLILLQADAGEIVYTFGNFAVGGNLGVGLIVFMIITIVQFIVITKGSERVAEVGARFSLDAMPGKQMSIDGDMRAGIIDANEARRQRGLVQKESQLYGAMDGAMKFVKGDAIAGIIIILVNILGGTAVGVFIHGMSAGTAMSTYAILSIGDGLISQIPALLISITAGIIVTRVPGEQRKNLASDLSEQITRQPQALSLAAGVLLVFALIPGFPVIYFVGLAGAVYGGAWWIRKRQPRAASNSTSADAPPGLIGDDTQPAMTPGAIPLMVLMASDLGRSRGLDEAFQQLRQKKFEQLGIPLPDIHQQIDASLEAGTLRILLYQEPVLTLKVPEGLLLADAHSMPLAQARHNDKLPFGGHTLQWLDPEQHETLAALGVVLHRDQARVTHCLSLVMDRYAADFIGVQETRFLMDSMENSHAELVKEVQRQMPIGRIADVLQRLVGEGVSIRDLRSILEALTEWSPREKDPIMLTEYVRVALRRHIATRYRGNQAWISGWMIGDGIEGLVRESIRQTAAGSYSTLEATQNQAIIEGIRERVGDGDPRRAVLITAIDVRRFVRKIVEREYSGLHVLSFQELGDEVELRVIGNIDLIEQA